jgi:outer membrane protein assembly factor BamB
MRSVLLGLALPVAACRHEPTGTIGGDRVLWHVDVPGVGSGVRPSFDATTVYFGDRAHHLVAVDKATGRVRWRQATGMGGPETAGSSTVVAGETVAMGDVDIYGFDRATGAPLWVFRPPDLDETGSYQYLVTDGATIYAGSLWGRVYAIDARSGQQRWVTPLPGDASTPAGSPTLTAGSPTLAEGVVFIGIWRRTNPGTGGLAALDATTGRILWVREFQPEAPGQSSACQWPPAISGPDVIASADDGRIYALDRTTGAVHWVAPRVHRLPPDGPYGDHRPLVVAGSVVVAGSTTGLVVGLDAATGATRWTSTANDGSVVFQLATNGRLVFATHLASSLAAFDVETGTLRWRLWPDYDNERYTSAPAADGDRVYANRTDGFFAVRAE